jgi:DNA-binding response OmpR family regulator
MKILIAEDEPMTLEALRLNLTTEGYEVICCCDGRDALEKFETNAPDLIITDIMMPFTSGLELIGIITSQQKKKTPIIVLSAIGQESTVMDAFQLGADDFIIKPFNPIELGLRVKRLLKNK